MSDANDFAMPEGGTWSIVTTDGETVSGYLPVWAQEDPSKTGVAPDRLAVELADITHEAAIGGEFLRVCRGAQGPMAESAALIAHMQCRPFHEDKLTGSGPRIHIQIFDDFWLLGLGPDEVAEIAVKFRNFADLLIHKVTPALYQAQNDWTAHLPVQHQQL